MKKIWTKRKELEIIFQISKFIRFTLFYCENYFLGEWINIIYFIK